MQDVDQSIVEKVRKILAKAEGASTQEEAETFFAGAQKLMTKHMIDEAMLAAAGERAAPDTIEQLRVNFGSTYHYAWMVGYLRLADALGFKMLLYSRGKNGYGMWYGWKSELDMAEMLIASLEIQVARAVDEFMRGYTPPEWMTTSEKREDRFKARRSFIEAFLRAVADRLLTQRMETLRAESKSRGQEDGNLLPVLMDRNALLDSFFQQRAGKATKIKGAQINGAGYGAGKRAGAKADVGQPRVGGSRGAIGR